MVRKIVRDDYNLPKTNHCWDSLLTNWFLAVKGAEQRQ